MYIIIGLHSCIIIIIIIIIFYFIFLFFYFLFQVIIQDNTRME